jgi:molybdopterin synthase catalytic subunit
MGLARMIETMKEAPGYRGMGMIASHLGVVRETSLNGTRVSEVQVAFDQDAIKEIINDIKHMKGIIQVIVETYEGRLNVGDEIMAVVVGGDTREHVFPALIAAVNRIKAEGTSKTEICES